MALRIAAVGDLGESAREAAFWELQPSSAAPGASTAVSAALAEQSQAAACRDDCQQHYHRAAACRQRPGPLHGAGGPHICRCPVKCCRRQHCLSCCPVPAQHAGPRPLWPTWLTGSTISAQMTTAPTASLAMHHAPTRGKSCTGASCTRVAVLSTGFYAGLYHANLVLEADACLPPVQAVGRLGPLDAAAGLPRSHTHHCWVSAGASLPAHGAARR